MTGEHAEAIGGLKTAVASATEGVKTLFASNEKRRRENTDLRFEFQSILHTVEETNATSSRAVELMEEMKKTVDSVKALVIHMDKRVTELENGRVDFVKVIRWLGKTRGVIFMLGMSALLIGPFSPDSRDFILAVIGVAGKAGV